MTQSVVTAGIDFMTNGLIRPNGLPPTLSREATILRKSFSNNNVDLKRSNKSADEIDSATTSSAVKTTSDKSTDKSTEKSTDKSTDKSADKSIDKSADKSTEKASSSSSVIEIMDESRSPEQPQKVSENVEEDACIQSIMDLSLPSPMSNGNMDECK